MLSSPAVAIRCSIRRALVTICEFRDEAAVAQRHSDQTLVELVVPLAPPASRTNSSRCSLHGGEPQPPDTTLLRRTHGSRGFQSEGPTVGAAPRATPPGSRAATIAVISVVNRFAGKEGRVMSRRSST